MKIIFATFKGEKQKKAIGKTLALLTLLVGISKFLTERISKEKGVSIEKSRRYSSDCIKDSKETVKE